LASSVKNVSAEIGGTPDNAPVVKQNVGAKKKDPLAGRIESITKRLGLSTEQQADIKLILQDEAAKLKVIRETTNLTVDEKKIKMQEQRDAIKNRIRSVLTDDQQIKYDEILNKIAEKRKNKQNPNTPDMPIK
jgi:hypothetical protein